MGDRLHQGRQTAVDQYAKELLPADGVCNLVAPKRAFRVLSEYFSTQKVPSEAKTGLKFEPPLCTWRDFEKMWDTLLAPPKLDPPSTPTRSLPAAWFPGPGPSSSG